MKNDILDKSPAFHLAAKFYARLTEPCYLSYPFNTDKSFVRGMLNLSHAHIKDTTNVKIKIKISSDWIESQPEVFCFAPWMKVGDDWHVNNEKKLCWDLSYRWTDYLSEIRKKADLQEVEDFAVMWCLNSTKSLIHKHLLANDCGFTEWQKDWKYWSHSLEVAREDYLRENRYRRSIC